MKSRHILLTLLFAASAAAEPIVVFDENWTLKNDNDGRAKVAFNDGVVRIEDADARLTDAYYYCGLTGQQRAAARTDGFVYEWSLRIPEETGETTRAISTEVCIRNEDPQSLLRFGLQFGRRGKELLASVGIGSDGYATGAIEVDEPDAFHDWALVFDGETQVLNLLVNQQLLIKARIDRRDQGYPLVFGSRSTGEGVSEWKDLRFSTGIGEHRIVAPPREASPRFWIMKDERDGVPPRVDVFVGGRDGYFAYRIPSFIVAPNGDLLVICEARKTSLSDDGDIDLLVKRSSNGGATWLPQELIYEEGGEARIKYGNPTAVVDRETGVIWVAVNRDHLTERGARAGGTLVLFKSEDSAKTWSEPIEITDSIKKPDWGHYAFGPGVGVQIRHGEHKGRLLIPANYRLNFDKRQPSYSHVIYSDDHGETWKLGGVLGDYTNECQLAEVVEDGKSGLLINMRNHWGRGGFPAKSGKRLVARSFDGGASWDAEAMDPTLPDPPCQASLYRFSFAENDEPSRLLFANPIGPGRSKLRIRRSTDEGRTWPHGKLIYAGGAAYSCMARLPNGRLGIIYERDNYSAISFSVVDVDSLDGGSAPPQPIALKFESLGSIQGTEEWDWWQARSAYVPGEKPTWLTTMSQTGKTGSHDFHDILQSVSRDAGRTWSAPEIVPSLKRTRQADGFEIAPGDLWPTFHAKTGKILTTGKTFNFEDGKREIRLRERVFYAVMDPATGDWGAQQLLKVPEKDHSGATITGANAGCTQRVDLPNGDVLLPIRYWRDPKVHRYTSVVARCAFDGETLTYKEHGTEHTVGTGRGLYEPSLTEFDGRYFLTLRANGSAYVTRGTDGIHFEPVREWRFDDGKVLGSYNTQQHWVTVGGGLFLVYTRRGAGNDHIMRHRAPLFIAQVNPDTLRVIRSTERVLIPENHATLGNSGVCSISANESWVTCGEGLLRAGKRKGELNRVFHIRITPQ